MKEADRQRIIRQKLCRLGERQRLIPAPISTGIDSVDTALGGGFPRGRISEIFGPEASGKTALALHAIEFTQRNGGAAALIDAEHTFDPRHAAAVGVDLERLVVACPDWGEQALEMAGTLAASGALDLVVVDSAAALVPRLELESSLELATPGLHSAVLGRALRKLAVAAARGETALMFLNQLRSDGSSEGGSTTAGGPALRAHAWLRVELAAPSPAGRTRLRVVKNKLGSAWLEAEFDIRWSAAEGS